MKSFSEMNEHRFPHSIADATAKCHAAELCSSEYKQEAFKPPFSEKIALEQHRLVIDLALGRWTR